MPRTRLLIIVALALPFIATGQSFEDYRRATQQGAGAYGSADERKEFESWRNQQQQEFTQYQKELMREFEVYTRTLREEYARYQRSIKEVWDQPEVSTPKAWVEYSKDRKTKRVVDYDKNEIRIYVVEQKGKDAAKVMEDALKDALEERVATAVKREPVMSEVDKKLRDSSPVVKKADPGKERVLKELFDKPEPTPADVEKKANDLLKKAGVKREVAKVSSPARPPSTAMVVTIPMPETRPLKKAEEYREMVAKHAGEWKINEPLVMAVIHTESAFNPMATSYVPAYGMMQIVPRYAGKEVSERLWGKPKLLAPSYLYNANNNVQIGTVYLNLLYYKYFKDVKDPESRLFCSIAAYNTGPGNVARAFTGNRNLKKAIPSINKLSSEEVYDRLRKHLPYDETKDYIERVAKRMKAYQDL
ncbi:MAG: transglycosylase SLT domain-containing protein [Gammaproteobacteria bacterium]|jgi:membrane-bound lytic murein transglycosylase C|nr:transglycosylase SLT domain-containing protein [Gammaproteobacteria bacterium]